jgi:hypothetical protein
MRQMLEQHHDVLRQVQGGRSNVQDTIERLTEIVESNMESANTRFAQLANQSLTTSQANDNAHRQFSEQLAQLQQRALEHPPQIVVTSTGQLPTSKSNQPTTQSSTTPSSTPDHRTRRTIEKLVPLMQKHAPSPTDGKQGEALDFKVITMPPTQTSGERRFTLVSASFSMGIGVASGEMLVISKHGQFPTITLLDTSPVPPEIDPPTVPQRSPDHGLSRPQPSIRGSVPQIDPDVPPGPDAKPLPSSYTTATVSQVHTRQTTVVHGAPDIATLSDELIEEKVAAFARKVVTLLADSAKADMSLQAAELKKIVDGVMTMIDLKIDREFVERMFNKFRVMLAVMNEKIENIQCSFLEWVTRDELTLVLEKFAGIVGEVQDSAAATGKYGCLLCGRKRSHVAGMSMAGEVPQAPQSSQLRPKTAGLGPKARRPVAAPLPGVEPDVGPTQKARDVVQFLTF